MEPFVKLSPERQAELLRLVRSNLTPALQDKTITTDVQLSQTIAAYEAVRSDADLRMFRDGLAAVQAADVVGRPAGPWGVQRASRRAATAPKRASSPEPARADVEAEDIEEIK